MKDTGCGKIADGIRQPEKRLHKKPLVNSNNVA